MADELKGMMGEGAPSQARPGNDVQPKSERPNSALNDARSEDRTFKNPEVDSLSAPAAGEVGDYMDNGEPSGGMQQGLSPRNNPDRNEAADQGPKTRAKNREMTRTGSPDQGTQ